MRILREELDRVDTLLRQNGFDKRLKKSGEDFARHLFTEIVRPREAVLKFSEPHPILAADPKAAVAELYGHYVERTFVTREYQEAVLEKGIRRLLYQARISERFSRVEVGNDEYHATFPFVEKQDERAVKVIKPLHLDHAQPSRILDHGGQWLFRIQTLKKRGLLPSRVLFAIRSPESQDSRSAAAREIAESLIDNGVEVLAYGESQRILEFAAAK